MKNQGKASTRNRLTGVIITFNIVLSMCMFLSNVAVWSLIVKEPLGLQSGLLYIIQAGVLAAPPLAVLAIEWLKHKKDAKQSKPMSATAIYILGSSAINTFGTALIISLMILLKGNSFNITSTISIVAVGWILLSVMYVQIQLSACATNTTNANK